MKTSADHPSQTYQNLENAHHEPFQPVARQPSWKSPNTMNPASVNCPHLVLQRKLQGLMSNSTQMKLLSRMQEMIDCSHRVAAQGSHMKGICGAAQKPEIAEEKLARKPRSPGPDRNVEVEATTPRLLQKHINTALSGQPLQLGKHFTYGGSTIEKTTINNQGDLDNEVEKVLDERFEGFHGLFQVSNVASSPEKWASLIFDYMDETYTLDGLSQTDILTSIRNIKHKYREEVLLHYAQTYVYGMDEHPYSADNLRSLMEAKKIVIEDVDEPVLEAIFGTEGKFARTKVEVHTGCLELSDEDNIVVIMDSHQNKHQNPQLPELDTYSGGSGSQFAPNKDLNWHRTHTVPVVRNTIKTAIENKNVSKNGAVYCPSKDAIDGIIYDLSIVYDKPTGKFVGSYHCNPVTSEQ